MIFDIAVGANYQVDCLGWTVNLIPTDNFSVEEKWKNVRSVGVAAQAEGSFCKGFYFEAEADYNWILQGHKVFDEFLLNDASPPQTTGWLEANTKGHIYDALGGVGYSFSFFSESIELTPLLGFSYNVLAFNDRHYIDNRYTVNFFQNVESSYRYRWTGPWIGVQSSHSFCDVILGTFEYRFHWMWYRGNVEDNFLTVSNEQQKNSHVHGNDFTLKLSTNCWEHWGIGLIGNYKFFFGRDGKNLAEGQTYRMDKLHWDSGKISLLCNVRF